MKLFVDDLNGLFAIIGQSKPLVSDDECNKAKELLESMHKHWLDVKYHCDITENMPPKYHYFKHMVEFMCVWRMPPEFVDEQSIEYHGGMCIDVRRCYLNQRGKLRVKYGMEKLNLITSPKYSDSYTNK